MTIHVDRRYPSNVIRSHFPALVAGIAIANAPRLELEEDRLPVQRQAAISRVGLLIHGAQIIQMPGIVLLRREVVLDSAAGVEILRCHQKNQESQDEDM